MQLGRYQVLKQLATGSIADVLLACASGLEGFARHVVIKRIHPELAREERFVSAFLEEARISASLHHQNIVQVHDIGDEGGSIYFAMEYVHGEDCRKLLNKVRERKEMVPLQHVVSIVMATAAGLHYAHDQTKPNGESKGIVHRDIAPANILIGYDGSVKLVDFGLARAAQRSTNATSSGTLRGKSSYMSPEQCTGKPIDRRTDTFSLGIVLYELLTAQRLFKGSNEFMTMAAIVDGEIPRPSKLRPDVPPALDEIVMHALTRPVEARYQSAEALRESLEAFAVAQELRISHKALADYLASLFGERQEPWLADPVPDPAWEAVEATHAGLVAMPRNPKELLHRFSAEGDADSPMRLAQATSEWSEEDEREPTSGQLPSLKRMGQPTEPTKTLRKGPMQSSDRRPTPSPVNPNILPRSEPAPSVSPNVRPRASEPPQTAAVPPAPQSNSVGDTTSVLPLSQSFKKFEGTAKAEDAKRFDETTGVTAETDPVKPASEATAVLPLDAKFELEVATEPTRKPPGSKPATEKTTDAVPLSTTVVEPPIFDGGLRPDEPEHDDDGLDEDEPATEIALNAPEYMLPEPVKEKVPVSMRRPVRPDSASTELQRANSGAPAPLRPGPRTSLPGSPTSTGMGAVGAREITPPSSPLMPTTAPMPMNPPMVSNAPPGSFAGVDPVAVAAGFHQQRGNVDPTFQGLQLPNDAEQQVSLRTGRRSLVIVGVGITIVVAGLLAMRACNNDSRNTPAAVPADAEVELDAATPVDAGVRRDAGVRDAGVRDAAVRDAGVRDAGAAAVTPPKRPLPKRPPPKRPKAR